MKNSGELHKGHRDRMRNRFIQEKENNFEHHELLELLLFYSIPRANTNETAHILIQKYGSLRELFEKGTYIDFKSVPGVGEKSAMLLAVVSALFKACHHPVKKKKSLKKISHYQEYLLSYLNQEIKNEVFIAVCLSDNGEVVNVEKLESGIPGKVTFNMHKLVKFVMQSNCTNLIIGHNHPNGNVQPSYQDIAETRKINEVLKTLEIILLDHIIVGNGQTYSMAEHEDF